ncbi:alpha/beta hydrolase [Neptunicoccus cionae]|uniref:Phospholipase n=1 Tax=Neptunicoccus cionae TaxID=2035344 RepID=A0A916QZ78_9RHOB|nr:phospholipase [Amylibacter cionae]
MALLESHKRAPKSGNTKSLVIFVHGYGADGNDLISLADPLAEHMPDTVFYAPDAPNRCKMNPMGFEWFPIPRMDGSTEEAARAGMEEAVALLGDWLAETMKAEGVTAAQTVLVGFSQGTMMSLHVGPRLADKLAGIVGFSGRLLAPEAIGDVVNKPPVLLIHGDMDDVVPPSSMPEAAEVLSGADFEVYTHVSKGTAHGIAPDGLGLALQFMMEKLKG